MNRAKSRAYPDKAFDGGGSSGRGEAMKWRGHKQDRSDSSVFFTNGHDMEYAEKPTLFRPIRGIMKRLHIFIFIIVFVLLGTTFPKRSLAWHDETHLAIAKVAGYEKWYTAIGADMTKLKAGDIESPNHYVNNPPGTIITPEMVIAQTERYNQIDEKGHLYGAIIVSVRDYIREKKKGKYGEYHLGFCAHYVGDLSMPLHNTLLNSFNRKHHVKIDGIIEEEVLSNLQRIKLYPIVIDSEQTLVKEVARIANLSIKLGYQIEAEDRLLTKEEAYKQISHSASLLKGVLEYVRRMVE
jgi:hypothetical protein